jgi:hypothetical protein
MAMSLFVCAATFAVFTYVGPLLEWEAGIPEANLPAMLFLFGIGGTIGLIAGGRIRDGKALQSVVGMFVALAILYGGPAAFIGSFVLVWAVMVAWGFLFLGIWFSVAAVARRIDGVGWSRGRNRGDGGSYVTRFLRHITLSLGFGSASRANSLVGVRPVSKPGVGSSHLKGSTYDRYLRIPAEAKARRAAKFLSTPKASVSNHL